MNQLITDKNVRHIPWNKGKLIGQKFPLKLKEIWAIRIRLQLANRTRELALFNLAIDSKLRACDLGSVDVSKRINQRVIVMPLKNGGIQKLKCNSWLENNGQTYLNYVNKNCALNYLIENYRLIFQTKRQQNLVQLRVCDVKQGNRILSRAIVMQQKTHRPVQFEITEQTRESLNAWISRAQLRSDQYL